MIGSVRLELRRREFLDQLAKLECTKQRLDQEINKISEKIKLQESRELEPKVFYPPLGGWYTAEEVIEYDCFFGQDVQLISTELTSLC